MFICFDNFYGNFLGHQICSSQDANCPRKCLQTWPRLRIHHPSCTHTGRFHEHVIIIHYTQIKCKMKNYYAYILLLLLFSFVY